jgi:hypothetical protein
MQPDELEQLVVLLAARGTAPQMRLHPRHCRIRADAGDLELDVPVESLSSTPGLG